VLTDLALWGTRGYRRKRAKLTLPASMLSLFLALSVPSGDGGGSNGGGGGGGGQQQSTQPGA
jgi:hypothetical protein